MRHFAGPGTGSQPASSAFFPDLSNHCYASPTALPPCPSSRKVTYTKFSHSRHRVDAQHKAMSPNPPKTIYRYQRFNVTTVESLCHDTLYFANPAAFNDPLDCQPTIDADSDIDTLRHLLLELVKRRVEAESLAVLNKVHLKSKKAAAHAKRLGEQAARTQLANIADHATNPEYEVSEEEAERWLLTSDIQHELLRQV